MSPSARVGVVLSMVIASAAWACRPGHTQLPGEVALDASTPIPVRDDSGADTTPPGTVIISAVALDLGAPGPCGQLESLSFVVEGDERARVVAAFGEKSELASTAPFEVLFEPPASGEVQIYLGSDKARSGTGFSREKLCFALAAVDDAGNVGPRSAPWCLNTVSGEGAASKTGCSVSPWLLAPLALLLSRRRRAQR